ncbi:hypothetical protein [Emticicia fontis]
MQVPDEQLLLVMVLLQCLLALILVLAVHFGKPDAMPAKEHYSEGFDKGSFRDLWLFGLILLLFIIVSGVCLG